MIYVIKPPYVLIFLQTFAEQKKAEQFQKDTGKGATLREHGWGFEFEIPAEEGVFRLFMRLMTGSNNKGDTYWSKLVFQVKRAIN